MKLHTLLIYGWVVWTMMGPAMAMPVHKPTHRHAPTPPGPTIKVLLEKESPSAFLEVKGPYRVMRRDNSTILSSGKSGKRFVVHALQDGLRWGEEYPDVYQIAVVPLSKDTSILVNGIQYKGMVSVFHVRNNHISIVNEVPIEDFLKSTMAGQYEEELSKDALSALAIAARTEAYSKVLQRENTTRPWDLVAQEAGYFGYGVTQQKNGVEEAIDWTRYMVLESIKQHLPLQSVQLSPTKADELAQQGYDAQKILKIQFPHAKIGATISADDVTIR